MLDEDGYPTEEALERLRKWDVQKDGVQAALDFAQSLWYYPDRFWREAATDDFGTLVWRYHVSTGGWSGNEEVIHAMRENFILWSLTWVQHRRGGHE